MRLYKQIARSLVVYLGILLGLLSLPALAQQNSAESQANKGLESIINGTISLPQARSESTGIYIEACTEFDGCESTDVTIPANQLSTTYSLNVNDSSSAGPYYLFVHCGDCDSPVFNDGYYVDKAPYNLTQEYDDRDLFSVATSSTTTINMTMILGSTLSGRITVPRTQSNNPYISVNVCNRDNTNCFSDGQSLQPGSLFIDYEVVVEPDDGYTIRARCSNCESPVFEYAYYVAADQSTGNVDDTSVDLSSDLVADFPLFDGTLISGTVSVPVPVSDLRFVFVQPCPANGDESICVSASSSVQIANGASSAPFSVVVAPDVDWFLEASCYSCDSNFIFRTTHYAEGEPNNSSWNEDDATSFPGDSPVTGLSLVFNRGIQLTGDVRLPSTDIAADDLYFHIFAYDTTTGKAFSDSKRSIDDGDSSTNFSFGVPDLGRGVQLGFMPSLRAEDTLREYYYPYGFYVTPTATSTNRDSSTLLPTSGESLNGLNMVVARRDYAISGSITTPTNTSPDETYLLYAIGDTLSGKGTELVTDNGYGGYGGYGGVSGGYLFNVDNAGYMNFDLAPLFEFSSTAYYNFNIADDSNTNWRVYYGCANCGEEYEQYGYFTGNASNKGAPEAQLGDMSSNPSNAEMFAGGQSHEVNMMLIPKEEICVPIVSATGKTAVICI